MRRRELLSVAAAAGFAPLAACVDEPPVEEPEDPVVEIVRSALVREQVGTEEETVYVYGVAENRSDKELEYVEIRARFYDEEGELLDSTVENIPDVTSGSQWEFEIEYPQRGEAAARVVDYELNVVPNP